MSALAWIAFLAVCAARVLAAGGCGGDASPGTPSPPVAPPVALPGPVTPLATPPAAPNGDQVRGMYVWVSNAPAQDPLGTDLKQQALIDFCGAQGCNAVFLDIWNYIGDANWTAAKAARMRQFVDVAHRSGIRVYALTGDLGFGTLHQWVMLNVIEPLIAFNTMATQASERFDGIILDVEYWQDETLYPAAVHLPGLCDLVQAIRVRADGKLAVGCYAAFWLKDNTGLRPSVTYNGKSAQDGEHLMDVSDFVLVGSYRDHAGDGGAEHGPGQQTISQPWHDYAVARAADSRLYVGSETIDVSPAYITYYGASKAQMEVEHTLISDHFSAGSHAIFIGQAVHSYDGWKDMP